MTKKNIVLFDMDGTLTPARESADIPIAEALKELSRHADIGIVTGSGYEYLRQQCGLILDSIAGPDLGTIFLLPCNGGQFYRWDGSQWKMLADKNILEHFGRKGFNELIKACIYVFNAAIEDSFSHPWNVTGHFVEYRGPMINLCFPGRQADKPSRILFQEIDSVQGVRNKAMQRLAAKLKIEGLNGLDLKLGGNTSVDIFPIGWDKTLALEHLQHEHVWFVGDRCTGSGNDREIYEFADARRRGYQTTSPTQTITIINDIINIIREK